MPPPSQGGRRPQHVPTLDRCSLLDTAARGARAEIARVQAMSFPVSIKGVLLDGDRVALLENERGEWELPGGLPCARIRRRTRHRGRRGSHPRLLGLRGSATAAGRYRDLRGAPAGPWRAESQRRASALRLVCDQRIGASADAGRLSPFDPCVRCAGRLVATGPPESKAAGRSGGRYTDALGSAARAFFGSPEVSFVTGQHLGASGEVAML